MDPDVQIEYGKDDTMAVARIGEVQAKPELTEELRDFLVSIMPGINIRSARFLLSNSS